MVNYTIVTASSDKTSVDTPRELLEGKTTQFYIGTEVIELWVIYACTDINPSRMVK